MKEQELRVMVICSSCGVPNEFDVPIVEFTKAKEMNKEVTHSQRCKRCGKWILEFKIDEYEEEEDES